MGVLSLIVSTTMTRRVVQNFFVKLAIGRRVVQNFFCKAYDW
jgi:hypothetical protein